jgi:ketopantoate hydroxymethyltransferase
MAGVDASSMRMRAELPLLPVTMEMMIPHTMAVRRGAPNVFLIGELPFLTYEVRRIGAGKTSIASD